VVPPQPAGLGGIATAVSARTLDGDFVPALSEFFGDGAGLSGPVVARLTRTWQDEQEAFASRSLAEVDYVYIWVDGVHFNVRLGEDRLCCLVVVGVRADGRKELVAITGGYRESTESWASLLRDCKHRGMRAPGARCRRRRPRVLGGGARRLS